MARRGGADACPPAVMRGLDPRIYDPADSAAEGEGW
jgi:hypothetical protein